MGSIDIIVILIFSGLVFLSGISFSRSGQNMKSFFAAGGALPWWMSGLSLFMSFFSAGTFVVWGSIAYSDGWVAVTIQWTMCIAGIIIGLFIAPRWQQTGALTAAEYITYRFGYNIQKIYTYLFLFISLFNTGAFLYPVAKIVEVSTGIPVSASIIFLGVLILIYTAVGGLWAVIVTDVLQFVVLSAAVVIVLPLSFEAIGGLDNFIHQAPENFFSLVNDEYTPGFMVAFGLYNLFFIAGNWAYVQRYTSVSTRKDAKKVGWVFAGLYSISPLIWMLPPMIYRVLNPELSGLADEGAYLLMCKAVLPAGMLGLILGGMIFATSSSVNTTLNISAGVLANDVYKHFFPNTPTSKLVKVGRLATVILGLLTILVALMVPVMGGIVEVVISLAAVTGGPMFLPPLWSLFSQRLTGRQALFTTLTALLVNGIFKFVTPELFDLKLSRAMEMAVGVGIPILLLLIIEVLNVIRRREKSLMVSIPKETSLAKDENNRKNNKRGGRIIGSGIVFTGILILLLSILGGEFIGIVAGTGFIVAILGGYIIFRNR